MSTPKQEDHYFDSIRPFFDHEVNEKIIELIEDPQFRPLLPKIFSEVDQDQLINYLKTIHSIKEFKCMIGEMITSKIVKQSTFSLTSSGKSLLPEGEKFVFISNHRDITLDSAFLNLILKEVDKGLPRVAIGDNLLIYRWIEKLVKLCDAFIVKRSPGVREMLAESKLLSEYIRQTITNKEESVWIAQREGRAKDSDDRTQPAVLKMLAMSGSGKTYDNIKELNIVPLCISYEYDPCDYLKAMELLKKKLNPEHKKTQQDDFDNMKTGILGKKGRVHYTFTEPLTNLEGLLSSCSNKQEEYTKIAAEIDRQIHLNYRLYPNNYAAYDLLNGTHRFSDLYSEEDRLQFELYVHEQIKKIVMKDKDKDFLKHSILEMYANPVVNHLRAKGLHR